MLSAGHIEELVDSFSSYLRLSRRFSANTELSYSQDVNIFLRDIFYLKGSRGLDLANITPEDFREWLVLRKLEKKIAPSSSARAISAIKCFFKFLEEAALCRNDGVRKLKSPKLPKVLGRSLEPEQVKAMLENPGLKIQSENDWKAKRFKAIVCLIYTTGMRVSEALSIKRFGISKSTKFIKILGKGGKERTLPLLEIAIEYIYDYLEASPISLLPDYPLFISERRNKKTGKPMAYPVRSFQRDVAKYGIKIDAARNATPHTLRRSFATHIIENGGDIRSVQSLLGHSSLSTTQKYVRLNSKVLERAYADFHPKTLKR